MCYFGSTISNESWHAECPQKNHCECCACYRAHCTSSRFLPAFSIYKEKTKAHNFWHVTYNQMCSVKSGYQSAISVNNALIFLAFFDFSNLTLLYGGGSSLGSSIILQLKENHHSISKSICCHTEDLIIAYMKLSQCLKLVLQLQMFQVHSNEQERILDYSIMIVSGTTSGTSSSIANAAIDSDISKESKVLSVRGCIGSISAG